LKHNFKKTKKFFFNKSLGGREKNHGENPGKRGKKVIKLILKKKGGGGGGVSGLKRCGSG